MAKNLIHSSCAHLAAARPAAPFASWISAPPARRRCIATCAAPSHQEAGPLLSTVSFCMALLPALCSRSGWVVIGGVLRVENLLWVASQQPAAIQGARCSPWARGQADLMVGPKYDVGPRP